jgi:hypothetical protein
LDCPELQRRFFVFFEDIIHHHLPDTDVNIDPAFEPHTQWPPLPPTITSGVPSIAPAEWDSIMATKVKHCGEVLQCHRCKWVCHKYGNDERCRFLFPHEVIEESYYDAASKSVVLKCGDGTMNYLNPYILVYCRHNHDLKCILSGRAAKAAMFYITDYITKTELKTHMRCCP